MWCKFQSYKSRFAEEEIHHRGKLGKLKANCDNIYDCETPIDVACYCSDGVQVQHWLGIPSITFGPDDIAWVHGDGKFVEIEDLILAQKALIATVLDWCGVDE